MGIKVGSPQGSSNFLFFLELFTIKGQFIAFLSKSQKSIFLGLGKGDKKIPTVAQILFTQASK